VGKVAGVTVWVDGYENLNRMKETSGQELALRMTRTDTGVNTPSSKAGRESEAVAVVNAK
jgi:hypothetical protein